MNGRTSLLVGLLAAGTLLTPGIAAATVPCDCYFDTDCGPGGAGDPVCVWNSDGSIPGATPGPLAVCTWRKPKPFGIVGAGCTADWVPGDAPACDGLCQAAGGGGFPPKIPTLSQSGVVVFGALLFAAMAIAILYRRVPGRG